MASRRGSFFWNAYARVYDLAWDSPISSAAARLVGERVMPAPQSTTVDLGCGTGLFGQAFGDVGRVIGVDTSTRMLQQALNSRRLDVGVVGDAAQTGLANEVADVVVVANVLHVATDPMAVMAEASRISRRAESTRLICVLPTEGLTPGKVALAERMAGRGLLRVVGTQFLRAHLAALAQVTGAVKPPDWYRVRAALQATERAGWVCEWNEVVHDMQEIYVFRLASERSRHPLIATMRTTARQEDS